jgi:methylated-DNA-protein-cysteine methyltransferase-like protein
MNAGGLSRDRNNQAERSPRGLPGIGIVRRATRCRDGIPAQCRARHVPMNAPSARPATAPASDPVTETETETETETDADADTVQSGLDFRSMAQRRVHGEIEDKPLSVRDEVFAIVRAIPRGSVMTYGQIAGCLGNRISPRAVGWMLHRCPDGVPWQRVVNASGGCSTDRLPDIPAGLQRAMLEAEGVEFGANERIDLERFRWWPPPDLVPDGAWD